jgi:ketosteroid isomerase-like protein
MSDQKLLERITLLEQRLRQVEDVQAIANLKATYIDGADGGWSWGGTANDGEAVAPLFAADGSWYSDSQGLVTGPDNIRKVWASFTRTLPFAYHRITNPKIVVAGDQATGEWHLEMIGTDRNNVSQRAIGVYNDEFVRTEQGWRFKRVRARIVFLGPNSKDWAQLMAADPRAQGGEARPADWLVMREEETMNIR